MRPFPPERLKAALARGCHELGRLIRRREGRAGPRKARRRSHRYAALGDEPATCRVTYEIRLERLTPRLATASTAATPTKPSNTASAEHRRTAA